MREIDGVKAYTASDPLDALPTACAFIAVTRKNRNRKTETVLYLRLKTEPNWMEFEKSKPTQPYNTQMHNHFKAITQVSLC